MPEITLDEIAEFVAAARNCRKESIHPDTTLAKDLGLDGVEAEELFVEFGRRFAVDLTSMRWEKHFVPEGWIMNPFIILWPPCWPAMKIKKLDIRIADLLVSARAGRWIFEYEKTA